MYAIQKNIKIYKKRRSKYPWEDMEIGDSFYIPKSDNPTPSNVIGYASKRFKAKYVSRIEPHGEGSRIWRIK